MCLLSTESISQVSAAPPAMVPSPPSIPVPILPFHPSLHPLQHPIPCTLTCCSLILGFDGTSGWVLPEDLQCQPGGRSPWELREPPAPSL